MCRPSGEATEDWVELMKLDVSISACVLTLGVFFAMLLTCKQRRYTRFSFSSSLLHNHNKKHEQ